MESLQPNRNGHEYVFSSDGACPTALIPPLVDLWLEQLGKER
jgi:hypothetical protein